MYYVAGLLFATMGASGGSELLLTKAYDKLAKRAGDPPAAVLLMGWNNIPVRAEKSLYDMALWCRKREALAAYLLATPARQLGGQLAGGQVPANVKAEDWRGLSARFADHLEQFGHLIFQLDFAESLPLDDPAPMLETIKLYLRGAGVNPHERQQFNEAKRVQTAETMLRRLRGLKRWAFRKALNWGQSMSQVREDALAQIGLGYPLLRALLHELGQRFVAGGVIRQAGDIYYLEKTEIDECVTKLHSGIALDDLSARVMERQAFIKKAGQVTPPPMMPLKKRVMGYDRFRPMSLVQVQLGMNNGAVSLKYRAVSPSIRQQRQADPTLPLATADSLAVEGAAASNYGFLGRQVEHVWHPAGVPVGYWRSVGHSSNAFVIESAIDELAIKANLDPIELRRQLLAANSVNPKAARALAVVNAAVQLSPWRTSLPAGHAWGVAYAEPYGSLVCQVVDISQPAPNSIKVHRVACAIDCGVAINPRSIEQQMQGGIVHGLNAALWGEQKFVAGKAVHKNFGTWRMLKASEMPKVEVVPHGIRPHPSVSTQCN